MRFLKLFAFSGFLVAGTGAEALFAQGAGMAVVEVFTSEGCSSCPPAEAMLTQLDRESRAQGLPVYALEWHVDYWDYLGWKDRFGSAEATQRQRFYARTLPSDVYTPQAVINGSLVPNYAGDLDEVRGLVRQTLTKPASAKVSLSVGATSDPDVVQLKVVSQGSLGAARVLAVLVEEGLGSNPTAGENSGRALHHSGVVRRSQVLNSTSGDFAFKLGAVDRSKAAVVLLVQDPQSFHILAACRADLPGAKTVSRWSGQVFDGNKAPRSQLPLQACSDQLCVLGSTDKNGEFEFSALPSGHYSLTVGTVRDVVEVDLVGGKAERSNLIVP